MISKILDYFVSNNDKNNKNYGNKYFIIQKKN